MKKELKNISNGNISLMTMEQKAEIFLLAPAIEKFLKAVNESVLSELQAGTVSDKVVLTTSRGARVWKDVEEVKKAFEEAGVSPYVEPSLQGVTFGDSVLSKEKMAELSVHVGGKPKVGIKGKDKPLVMESITFDSVEPAEKGLETMEANDLL